MTLSGVESFEKPISLTCMDRWKGNFWKWWRISVLISWGVTMFHCHLSFFFFKMFKLVITEHHLISRATPCLICVALLVYFSIRLDFCLHGLLLNKVFPSNVVYHFSLHLKCLVLLPSSQTVRWLAWQLRTLIGCLKCQLLMPFWCL